MTCYCSECECERQDSREPEVHEARFRRHDITVSKDSDESDWYIVVTGPSGLRDYDGWWRESRGKTWEEAVEEAKRGAMLTTPIAARKQGDTHD